MLVSLKSTGHYKVGIGTKVVDKDPMVWCENKETTTGDSESARRPTMFFCKYLMFYFMWVCVSDEDQSHESQQKRKQYLFIKHSL
jgi:hypothetical protein